MTTGVLLLTYGSAKNADDVPAYLSRIRGGRPASDELVAEFQRRYQVIGGSPLIPITQRLAIELERQLGAGFVVEAGMRFSEPTVEQAARRAVERGADQLLGLILAPQYSPIIMGQYDQMLAAAGEAVGRPARMVGSWHLHSRFIGVLGERLRAGLARFPADQRDHLPVLMTAHSLPKRVVDREPGYIDMLRATAVAVAREAGLPDDRWHFAYQSAGHTPEEWLKPDMLQVLPELARAGHKAVLLAPVQFVADHLETLYDIDVAGKEQAEEAGVEHFARVPAPNDSPEFAAALAAIVRDELKPN
jgi:ferrochelatase